MRPLKRLLVFAVEVGTFLLGLFLSVMAAVLVQMFGFDPAPGQLHGLGSALFLGGLVLTIVAFRAVRRRTRPWKIDYDAVGWELTRAERKLHPRRARVQRLATRVLVWAPSLLAFVVLFFFPAASHLIRPGTQTLGPYRLYIPWTLAILPAPQVPDARFIWTGAMVGSHGGFGVTAFWRREIFSSIMGFGSRKADPDNSVLEAKYAEQRRAEATQLLRKEFQLSGVELICWQYLSTYRGRMRIAGSGLWRVDCETRVGVKGQLFYAWFLGRDTDIPAFYRVIKGTVPIL